MFLSEVEVHSSPRGLDCTDDRKLRLSAQSVRQRGERLNAALQVFAIFISSCIQNYARAYEPQPSQNAVRDVAIGERLEIAIDPSVDCYDTIRPYAKQVDRIATA